MNQSNILDNPFPDIGVRALEPTQYKRFLVTHLLKLKSV